MISLVFQDGETIKQYYKFNSNKQSIDKIIDNEKILKTFISNK